MGKRGRERGREIERTLEKLQLTSIREPFETKEWPRRGIQAVRERGEGEGRGGRERGEEVERGRAIQGERLKGPWEDCNHFRFANPLNRKNGGAEASKL